MTKPLPWAEAPPEAARARLVAAWVLRAASAVLARLAERLAVVERAAAVADPVLEFYAEAGAPEGALYVDGRLVARLPGVQRL